ncbi:hypothetical protein Tco_1105328 [Tanacetum coccineum]
MVNLIPPNHVDDVPVVEPNQHDDVSVVPEPVLEDERGPGRNKNLRKRDDIGSRSRGEDREWSRSESSTASFLREDSDGLLPGLMRRDINSLFGRMASLLRRFMEQGMAAMERLVKKLGNAEDKVECKKLKKELKEARFSNTFLRMQNEQVERDLYWTRVSS